MSVAPASTNQSHRACSTDEHRAPARISRHAARCFALSVTRSAAIPSTTACTTLDGGRTYSGTVFSPARTIIVAARSGGSTSSRYALLARASRQKMLRACLNVPAIVRCVLAIFEASFSALHFSVAAFALIARTVSDS